MPEGPYQQPRRPPVLDSIRSRSESSSGYAELHCKSNFSFLEGASHPDELVQRAAELGHAAIAIADRNSLGGVVRAHVAAKEAGLKLLVGAEIFPTDAPPVVLLAMNRSGYARLSTLITIGRRRANKGECDIRFRDIAAHADGLIACVPLLTCLTQDENRPRFFEAFGDRAYGLAELHLGANDGLLLRQMVERAAQLHLPLAAANDVHYHIPQRQPLQDVLTATRHGCTVAALGKRRFSNAERHLKSSDTMRELFTELPDAVARTLEVVQRCDFSLDELRYEYPRELAPAGESTAEFLTRLTWDGALQRYPQGVPDHVRKLVQHELQLIRELHYEPYFLTVWDLVRFARGRGILCQGRGSAANSAVCFCLGVTEVDPDRIDVLFERFISKERNEPPDIDIDFEHERREEVIQYVYEKYGRDRAGMTGVVTTYRLRSAVRDVGKALGFSLDAISRLSGSFDRMTTDENLPERFADSGVQMNSRVGRQFFTLVQQIRHFPRHLSQHVGGLVMTRGPLHELCPIENASMADRTVVQWNKDDLDALGILKVDCLSLGMLTAIRKCFDFIRLHHDRTLTLATVPPEDPHVYDMISAADTIGVFQIESRAQMAMLPRLKPNCFYDLVIEVAIVRPGPIQGDMVHPYLRRRCGEEPVEFPDDRIRSVLMKTLGVPIFQEQAMRLAVVAGGFTPGEADQLRRAMGAWRKTGQIEKFRVKLIEGMLANGYEQEFAERVFRQIQGFGEYGFPESHAASFALLVYVSAWLKHYYPAAFAACIINSQPMGFYAPAQLITDAKQHGVEVRPVDVNFSNYDCTLESSDSENNSKAAPALRLGFRLLRGLAVEAIQKIVTARGTSPFTSFDEFRDRTGLSSAVLSQLSRADTFASLSASRRPALWKSLPDQSDVPLFPKKHDVEAAPALPELSDFDHVIADYQHLGLSLRGHPLTQFRPHLKQLGIVSAVDLKRLPVDRKVRVAGVVLLRQHPASAKGITFMTLEDETGTTNIVIHPDTWNRFRRVANTSSAMIVRGLLQRERAVIHVVIDHMEDMTAALHGLNLRSRDFR